MKFKHVSAFAALLIIARMGYEVVANGTSVQMACLAGLITLGIVLTVLTAIDNVLCDDDDDDGITGGWDHVTPDQIEAMDETMTFIQHDDSRRVDTRKDPILLAPGSIERFKRPRNFRVGLVVGALLLIVVVWVAKHI